MQPAITRAVTMCTLIALTHIFSYKTLSLNACILTAVLMLLIDPLSLFNIGFQLSFLAVIGICTIGLPLCKHFSIYIDYFFDKETIIILKMLANSFISICVISMVCTTFTLPVVAYTFHRIPLLSLLSTLLTSTLVSLLMFASILWWALLWCPPVTAILTPVVNGLASLILSIAEHISDFPYSVYPCSPGIVQTVLLYIPIIAFINIIRSRTPRAIIIFLLTLIVWLACALCFTILDES